MEQTITLAITLAFEDSTSRTYNLSGVEESEVSEIKDRILALKANMPENFKRTFVSNNGEQCTTIATAKIISVEEEVIYNAG